MVDFIKLTAKFFILDIKKIFAEKVNVLIIFIFPAVAIMIPVIFVPLFMGAGALYLVALIPLNGIIFATLNFTINNSTLRQNLNLRKNSKYPLYISTVLVMFLVTFITVIVIYAALAVLNQLGLTKSGWLQYDPTVVKTNWDQLGICVIAGFEISALVFSISFMLQRFFSTMKAYFILILAMAILAIIFGADFNNYFVANQYPEGIKIEVTFSGRSIFPKSMFIPSLIFPFYSPAQLIVTSLTIPVWDTGSYVALNSNALRIIDLTMSTEWSLVVMLPVIETVTFLVIGAFISKAIKEK